MSLVGDQPRAYLDLCQQVVIPASEDLPTRPICLSIEEIRRLTSGLLSLLVTIRSVAKMTPS